MFTSVLLADEINRTPPKTQAALLEAMEERQVTIEGQPRPLPDPFIVLATQNPVEYEGTYPLPEAQLDRFLFKLELGYPDEEAERAILNLRHRGVRPATLEDVRPVVDVDGAARGAARDRRHRRVGRGRGLRDRNHPRDANAAERRARRKPARGRASARRREGRGAARRARLRDAGRRRRRRAGRPTPRLLLRPEAELERYRPDDAVRAALEAVPVPR